MKTYLFNTEALGGYMLQGNPIKRMLKTEIQGEGEDQVVVKLNEIRSSDLVAGEGETLQIVDDVITVVPRPPRVPVLGAVKKHTFFKRLTALGKWKAFKTQINKTVAVADLYNNSHELDINDPDVIELSPLIKTAVGVTDEEYNSLFEA
tara:strand:- start:1085 stop:1531 length:447 start_codon:yes stop_codon:yes gene_type:complete